MVRAPLIEVFHSIQGEGRHVGRPMAFVRTATCPIRCRYCDTTSSYKAPAEFSIVCGSATQSAANPVLPARALEAVEQAERASPYRSSQPVVSVTGGEPLVFPRFVAELGQLVRSQGRALHLETAALDAKALREVLPQLAHLSADYKLRGTLKADADGEQRDHSAAHIACLEAAAETAVTIDVKLVVTPEADGAAIAAALKDLRPLRERILLIVQPVTPALDVSAPATPAEIERVARQALDAGFEIRVIPQVHKLLGVI